MIFFNRKIRFIHLFWALIIVCVDIFVFLLFGLLLMDYDDNYETSKGPEWSLASMNDSEKVIYIGYNLWSILNILALLYLGFRIYKLVQRTLKNNS